MSRSSLIACISAMILGICFSYDRSLAQSNDLFAAKWQLEIGGGVFLPDNDSHGIHGRLALNRSLSRILVTGLQYRGYYWNREMIGGGSETYSHLIGLRLAVTKLIGAETQFLLGGAFYLAHARVNQHALYGPPVFGTHSKLKGTGTVAGIFAGCLFPLNSRIGLGLDLEYNQGLRSMGDAYALHDIGGFWPGLFVTVRL